ncbi:hypothetical protein [Candidatus Mycobacterium methanotrophicum]|uniref:Uncharacterized protein n=2 Tax=Candidatus Mycobacterium methanotrophicum TaxID=2943498 RepID=A0ABY4QQG7_9MYCO|nr:hypothetical protein [Candidatus Mycobacterium methanotrophicum]UQX12024.1 hypothetical protein M5I08_06675 [Candidatus Mycobacterium methanotrophicum]
MEFVVNALRSLLELGAKQARVVRDGSEVLIPLVRVRSSASGLTPGAVAVIPGRPAAVRYPCRPVLHAKTTCLHAYLLRHSAAGHNI